MPSEIDFQDRENQGVFHRILVGVDESEPAQWAIRMAAQLAATNGAQVALIHVVPGSVALTPEFSSVRNEFVVGQRYAGQQLLERVAENFELAPRPELILKEGEPSQQIIATAKEWRPDLIVVGTHGRGSVAHMLLGSTAESVVRHAHAPVLTVGCDPAGKSRQEAESYCCGCACGNESELMAVGAD